MEPDDLSGKVVIELELDGLVASIAFWNKGDLTVSALRKSDLREFSLDDRCIRSDESVPMLLDRYIQQIIALTE
jgi:hypothetical protein